VSLRSSDAERRRMRAYLEARDGRSCARCGDPFEAGETASLGHVIAVAHGGSDDASNLRLEHLACNREAGADDDRARIVQPIARESAQIRHDSRPVSQRARKYHGARCRPWNGARTGANNRTSVRIRLIPPDPARGRQTAGDGS